MPATPTRPALPARDAHAAAPRDERLGARRAAEPAPCRARRLRSLAATAALLAIAGCAVPPAAPPSPPLPPGASISTASDEAQRLRQLFDGTPVAIEATREGRLRVAVPQRFAFDAGRSAVKAPLAKVLDHLSASVKRLGDVELRITAASDPKASPRLATERAAAARDYLVGRGVPASRFALLQSGEIDGIELLVGPRR